MFLSRCCEVKSRFFTVFLLHLIRICNLHIRAQNYSVCDREIEPVIESVVSLLILLLIWRLTITMFWKYNSLTVSHLDTLLDKQGVTLQEILEQEDIIQECKSQNKKLVD